MKKLFSAFVLTLFVVVLTSSLKADEITAYGEVYEVEVPEDYEALKALYLETATWYIEESVDFESLNETFDKYKLSAEETLRLKDIALADKDTTIAEQDILIEYLQDEIKILKKQKTDTIAFIPSVEYVLHEEGSGFGVGLGILLWENFFTQVRVQYPTSGSIGIGWSF